MGEHRGWLDVPYADKDHAKALGARWDPAAKRWYAPPAAAARLARWAARPPVPVLLPGEDRCFGSGLFVDLVPSSCWFTNTRTCIAPTDWERLRRMITTRAGNRCEACGRGEDRPTRRWLETHERWAYNDAAGVQSLRRLICLCSDCHHTTHYGLAHLTGTAGQAFDHLRSITAMTPAQADDHIAAAFDRWDQRSRRTWTLDLTILTATGITLTPPPDAPARPAAAEHALTTADPAGTRPDTTCTPDTGPPTCPPTPPAPTPTATRRAPDHRGW